MSKHVWSFLWTTWEMLRNALSTSDLALIVFSLCVPVVVFVFAVIVNGWNEARSFKGLVVVLKASVKPVFIGAGVTALAWVCLFSWALYKSAYNDHHNLTGRLGTVVNEKNALKVGLKQRDDYIERLKNSKAGPFTPKGGSSSSPPATPQNKLVWYSLFKDNKTTSNGLIATEFLVYPNQTIVSPVTLEIHFTGIMRDHAKIEINAAGIQTVGPTEAQENTLTFTVQTPNLAPSVAAHITVYSDHRVDLIDITCKSCP